MNKREIKFRAWFSITDGDNSFSAMIPDVVVYPDQRLGRDFETFKNAIKSSGWKFDEFGEYFVRGENLISCGDSNVSVYEGEWASFDGIPMQYTGLKNLGGVEIYEGDIVKFRSHPNKAYIGTVEYSDEFATFHIAYFPNKVSKDRKYPSFQRLGSCDTIEVIGNIYENAELLNK